MNATMTGAMRTLTSILFLALWAVPAQAAVEIAAFAPPTAAGACDGYIEVRADGTAGPFRLTLLQDWATVAEAVDVQGVYRFGDLCAGAYEVLVSNAYECSTTLRQELGCSLEVEVETSSPG